MLATWRHLCFQLLRYTIASLFCQKLVEHLPLARVYLALSITSQFLQVPMQCVYPIGVTECSLWWLLPVWPDTNESKETIYSVMLFIPTSSWAAWMQMVIFTLEAAMEKRTRKRIWKNSFAVELVGQQMWNEERDLDLISQKLRAKQAKTQ